MMADGKRTTGTRRRSDTQKKIGATRKKTQTKKNGKGPDTGRKAAKNNGFLILIMCLMLVTLAVFGGYALARYIRSGGSGTKPQNETAGPTGGSGINDGRDGSGADNGDWLPTDRVSGNNNTQGNNSTAVLAKNPSEIIFSVDPDTRKIREMLVGILRTGVAKLDYIRIDTGVSYTMSAGLYTGLTPDNTTLPQTVTFSELYKYYNNDKAFDAGRRIVSEMLSCDVIYYTAMTDADFKKIFNTDEYSGGTVTGFAMDLSSMKDGYGTDGSLKGFIAASFSSASTNWPADERLRYLDTWDLLDERDVKFTDAPVEEKNESKILDTDAVGRILYDILY